MDLPNIRTYQLGAHLRNISNWITKDVSPVWLDIETSFSKYSLPDLLFFKSFKIIEESCVNPVTLNTLRAWWLVRRLEGRSKSTSGFSPILHNPDFQPGMMDAGLRSGAKRALLSYKICSLMIIISTNKG